MKFASEILPIIDEALEPRTLERLHEIAAMVLKWSGFKDNGVAFSLSEYSYEVLEIARGKKDTGWKDEARASLDKQLKFDS